MFENKSLAFILKACRALITIRRGVVVFRSLGSKLTIYVNAIISCLRVP